jgi:hypothetical protein
VTIDIAELSAQIGGRQLPGAEIVVEPHESAIADEALRSTVNSEHAHPAWFVIASLRGMGISVDELCALAQQVPGDTLLFGSCIVTQRSPMRVGARYTTTAAVGAVTSRTMRDGSRLDSIEVRVEMTEQASGVEAGDVVCVYLFKRGAA